MGLLFNHRPEIGAATLWLALLCNRQAVRNDKFQIIINRLVRDELADSKAQSIVVGIAEIEVSGLAILCTVVDIPHTNQCRKLAVLATQGKVLSAFRTIAGNIVIPGKAHGTVADGVYHVGEVAEVCLTVQGIARASGVVVVPDADIKNKTASIDTITRVKI